MGRETGQISQEEGEQGRAGVADGTVGRDGGWLVRQNGISQS